MWRKWKSPRNVVSVRRRRMAKDKIGITFNVEPGKDPIPIYHDENGVEAFETDAPYLVAGQRLMAPIPAVMASGPVHTDVMGNAADALAVKLGRLPPDPEPSGITWDG